MAQSDTATPFKLTVTEPEMWQRKIHVEIDPAHFEAEYGKNLRKARKGHARPGFRKGKVPMAMVEQDLGGTVRMDTLEELVPRAYQAAMIEHGFFPVSDPVLKDLAMNDDEPVKLELEVEVRPVITPKDYDDLPLTARDASLADGAVDEALERLRESRAPWETAARAARAGDRVKVDILPEDESGEPDEARRTEGYSLQLGDENNFEAFEAALIGASAGDEVKATVSYPEDHPGEALRGKTMTYRMTVKEVTAQTLPELDDAFASSLQDGQTLLELRAAVREELQKEEEQKADAATREQIVDLLLERNAVEVPPSMLNDYLDGMADEMRQRSAMYGRPVSDEELAQYRESARAGAERTIKAMFVLEAVRKAEGIEVRPEDIDERIEETAKENGWPVDQYREYVKRNREEERIGHELAETRTFDFLKSRAKFSPAADAAAGG